VLSESGCNALLATRHQGLCVFITEAEAHQTAELAALISPGDMVSAADAMDISHVYGPLMRGRCSGSTNRSTADISTTTMFVRYRKVVSDGFEPCGVQAQRNCNGSCRSRYRSCMGRCPKKPRCRWRIGLLQLPDGLVPYRLQVSLIENQRDDGKVRQEHIADLGSIDGHLLPEFWAELDASKVLEIQWENWSDHSVYARIDFWETAKPRIDHLANRLDPRALRLTIDRRIPWPRQAERDLAEAREEFRRWNGLNRMANIAIEGNEKTIAAAAAENAELRREILTRAPFVAEVTARMARLTKS